MAGWQDCAEFEAFALVRQLVSDRRVCALRWARDGNGDNVEDPNNVFDAAMTAATYLCRAAPAGLTADDALLAAFFSYNHSEAYSLTALHWSKVYDAWRPPRGPIVTG